MAGARAQLYKLVQTLYDCWRDKWALCWKDNASTGEPETPHMDNHFWNFEQLGLKNSTEWAVGMWVGFCKQSWWLTILISMPFLFSI